jgi:drug/metabolite transporter (DMT)-like permease
VLPVVFALLAAATNAVASVLQRKANLEEIEAERTGVAALVGLLRQPRWLTAIAAMIFSFALQGAALSLGAVALVQPLMALDLPMTLLLASLFFHRRLGGRTWGDIAVMTVGTGVFLFALAPAGGSPDAASGVEWALAAGATGLVVALLAVAGAASRGRRRAALLGVAAGVCFALTAVFMSAALADGLTAETFTRWQTYLVAVAGIAALVCLQEALRAGELVVVQPGVTLSDPVIAVVLGVFLFQESVGSGPWIGAEVLGMAAVVWGAVRLSRSPALADDDEDPARSGDDPAGGTGSGSASRPPAGRHPGEQG